jgi:predicted  nucleic acid-binding Zn-ribbon protein
MKDHRVSFPQYLIAHACFNCRKSFKLVPRKEARAVCPGCGGELHEMGRSFKAPLSRDMEQWLKVQALYKAGFRFSSYRSTSGPPLPARLSEVDAFIRDNPAHPLRVAAPNHSFEADGFAAAQLKR